MRGILGSPRIVAELDELKKTLSNLRGVVKYHENLFDAELDFVGNTKSIKIGTPINLDNQDEILEFSSSYIELLVDVWITANRNSFTEGKYFSRFSEGKIHWLATKSFDNETPKLHRGYFLCDDDKLIYTYFGLKDCLSIVINNHEFNVYNRDKYLIIDTSNEILSSSFHESSYNLLVAIGVVSGQFIQNDTYTFQYRSTNELAHSGFQYRRLRRSANSLYHSLTHNPYSYKHFLEKEYADKLYANKTLKPCDAATFSKLVAWIADNSEIQYALVLFNEANDNGMSLMIKNNCFYVVLEVLKKFFYEHYIDRIPDDYSRRGNLEKYKVVFSMLISFTVHDINTLKGRNVFMHGDIKTTPDQEMHSLMLKQITLIYRLVFSFLEFDGLLIDHYAIRNEMTESAFINAGKM